MELFEVIADAKETVEDLIKAAFQAGVREGRQQTITQFRERFEGMFDDGVMPFTRKEAELVSDTSEGTESRAIPGSVKPAIEKMLLNASNGITASEIAARGSFKHNTVRGTLWTLGKEGFAAHENGRWFAIKKKEGALASLEEFLDSDDPPAEASESSG